MTRGRPPAASRELLQEAAFELFLEQGYAGTTVEHITRRAGVSRNTFFNYFSAKGDVFWVELDESLAELEQDLSARPAGENPVDGLREAIRTLGQRFGPESVPFALTQHALIGSVHELQASAVSRFSAAAAGIRGFLTARGSTPERAQALSYAAVGAAIAAAQAWAAAGPGRGSLAPQLESAIGPVLAGFDSAP